MVKISAKNFKLTEPLKNYVENKIHKVNLYLKEADVKVVLEVRKSGNKIETTILDNDTIIKSEAFSEDMYAAVDMVIDKLKNQLERYAGKKNSFKNESIRKYRTDTDYMPAEEEKTEGVIVKRKVFNLKPMYEEEAILQIELLGHPSFMFLNAETEKICLLYKRKDGNYGIIEAV